MVEQVAVRARVRAIDTEGAARDHVQPVAPQTGSGPLAVGYVQTSRVSYNGEHTSREEVRVPVFHTAPARVRVGGTITQNLGDYNSTRVEVAIEMPCLPEESEVQRVYESLSAKVDEMLRRELQLATGVGASAPPGYGSPLPQQH